MNKRKIVPCLDIRDGKVVKGVKFEGVRDVGDPVALAEKYNADGADEIVLYDISASIEKRIIDLNLVKAVAEKITVGLTVAGGIGTVDDFQKVTDAGASRVSINSLAIRNPDIIKEFADKFGTERVVLGVDAKRGENGGYKVMQGAGIVETGLNLIDWVKKAEQLGAGEICLNSIDADGTQDGYDIDMLNAVCDAVNIPVIASGGCGKLEHFAEVFEKTKAGSALAASMFHFGGLTVKGVKEYLINKS
ncbi:MAG: imidazole glycerol phosphate synthase subunit HisF [Oscillospiraceae bacterium]|nr:imidazole glycerol phosphate synthase subunit HisF [Oscillospiraceae bacterium]